jgi:hypothetical protein
MLLPMLLLLLLKLYFERQNHTEDQKKVGKTGRHSNFVT